MTRIEIQRSAVTNEIGSSYSRSAVKNDRDNNNLANLTMNESELVTLFQERVVSQQSG